jgi:branched-chain amino acid transport system ATP-binding protein
MILEVNDIHTFYGTSHVLFGVRLSIDRGETVALLGRNGAGKTTTLRSIINLTIPRSGSIKFLGEEILGKPPYYIAQRGIGFVPDNRLIFPDLTVRENLEVGYKKARDSSNEEWSIKRIYGLFPALEKLDDHLGGYLSGGEQQMLTVGRTLMGNPILLLLDEPVEGVAPLVVRTLGDQVLKLKEMGHTILLSEQNLRFAMRVSNRAYVISKGVIRYSGSIDELKMNEEVKKEYLMI